MSLTITNKSKSKCNKYEFNIYEHTLSLADLDTYILDVLYDETNLNYLFQVDKPLSTNDRIKQLQRFIENSFKNKEHEIKDVEIIKFIDDNKIQSYYSFFAEALLARLNIQFLDSKLIIGVINVGDNLKVVGTGADVCMFSDDKLVLGEAKFYGELYGGVDKIIKDTSFLSKLEDYISKVIGSDKEIILKGIDGNICTKTVEEIKKISLILSGFVLHTKEDPVSNYDKSYNLVEKIKIKELEAHYNVHLYHLPIESKNELIFKAQRKALDLIIKLRGL